MSFIQDLNLADPDFDADGRVDLFLGQEHAVRCERPGAIYSPDGDLKAQRTIFGWTVAGSVKGVPTSTSACLRAVPVKDGSLEFIQQFWALEAVPGEDSNLTVINLRIMDYFEETTTRDKDGRYHVSLLRKDPAPALGES